MDNIGTSFPSTYSIDDPGMKASVHSSKDLAKLSPYLNFDASYLQEIKPAYLFPEGETRPKRRLRLSAFHIGCSYMVGAAIGGIGGMYNGFKSTSLAGQTGKLRRTQILNHVTKQATTSANAIGTIVLMYYAFYFFVESNRQKDDCANDIVASTATGLLYKSTAGLRKCAIGGGLGFGIATLYTLCTSRNRMHNSSK